MPIKAYYSSPIATFLNDDPARILGVLTAAHHHALEEQQRWAWLQQISILQAALANHFEERLFLEFYIPRMGKRADAVLIAENIVFIIESKAGATGHTSAAFDQVEDYALDLKNFHEGSHTVPIVPILVSINANTQTTHDLKFAKDLVAAPIGTNERGLGSLIKGICTAHKFPVLQIDERTAKGYKPTPTIVQAAEVLYRTHRVTDISRKDAGAKNLQETTDCVTEVIDQARHKSKKAICFVTGVPGSGKTLAGLNLATRPRTGFSITTPTYGLLTTWRMWRVSWQSKVLNSTGLVFVGMGISITKTASGSAKTSKELSGSL